VNVAHAKLQALCDQGLEGQWDPALAIDWNQEIAFGTDLPDDPGLRGYLDSPLGHHGRATWNRFRWQFQIWLVSQFLHGEQVALDGAARIRDSVADPLVRQAAAVQVMDEQRHILVFRRYLQEHAPDGPYATSPAFADLIRTMREHSDRDFELLGIQVLIEGIAVAAFRMAGSTLHDPLIRSIVQAVQRDEARHAAFGVLNLKPLYADMTAPERRERVDFLLAALELTMRRFLLPEVWERIGIVPGLGNAFADQDPVMIAYRRTLLLKAVSTIRSVGLLDARMQRGLEGLGIRFSNATIDAAIAVPS
jgi:hypothetical protein